MKEITIAAIQRKVDDHRKAAKNAISELDKAKLLAKAQAYEDVLHTIKIFETFEGK